MKNLRTSIAVFLTAITIFIAVLSGCSANNTIENSNSTKNTQAKKTTTQKKNNSSKLEVHYIDIGQGDCTLLKCGGQSMLIDAGNNNKGTQVQSYLESQGIEKLDIVIGTHPDADHIGGLDVVIYKFDCKTIIMPDVKNDTATYRDVISAMKSKDYTRTNPVVGTEYKLGSSIVTIIAPVNTYGSALNDWSVGVLVQNGDNRFLFTGDAEEDAEADILNSGIDISADVYKVAHHGSKTATTESFLDAINPTSAVISCGEGNSYFHPHAEVLNRLRAKGIEVYRTDEEGTVVASSDGKEITWNMSPSTSWKAGDGTKSSSNTSSTKATTSDKKNTSTKVYVTDTGTKYHLKGCESLKKSSHEISLSEAKKKGLTPCSKCNPPK